MRDLTHHSEELHDICATGQEVCGQVLQVAYGAVRSLDDSHAKLGTSVAFQRDCLAACDLQDLDEMIRRRDALAAHYAAERASLGTNLRLVKA